MVYSIRSHQTELVYYGSTSQGLSQRMAEHRKDYKRYLAGKHNWVSSFQIIAFEEAYIELVRVVDYEVKAELHAVECELIRNNTCVNKVQPGRSHAQYRIDTQAHRLKYQAEYNAANVEHIKEYKQQKHICDCGGKYITCHKAKHIRTAKHKAFELKE